MNSSRRKSHEDFDWVYVIFFLQKVVAEAETPGDGGVAGGDVARNKSLRYGCCWTLATTGAARVY